MSVCRLVAILAVLIPIAFGGCAKPRPGLPPDCPRLYTILPGNFIIDLAAGSRVTLNPARERFPLFCSPQKAKAALQKAKGDWRVYALKGVPSELAQTACGSLVLAAPAEVDDWVE